MQPERHQVVHDVVLLRYRIEYATNARRFFARADLFEAEVGGFFLGHPGSLLHPEDPEPIAEGSARDVK